MNHQEYKILLSGYLDGELDHKNQQIIQEHLNGCKECQEELLKYADMNSINVGGYETRFIDECMLEKGYKAVTEDELPLRVKRKDPPKWYLKGIAGTLEEE